MPLLRRGATPARLVAKMTPGRLPHPNVQYTLDFFWPPEEIGLYLGGDPAPQKNRKVSIEA
ncbi:MAG TPA: hypothetical protein VI455_04000 [Terriglobia bacterium]